MVYFSVIIIVAVIVFWAQCVEETIDIVVAVTTNNQHIFRHISI